jgi:hypothetical protein
MNFFSNLITVVHKNVQFEKKDYFIREKEEKKHKMNQILIGLN